MPCAISYLAFAREISVKPVEQGNKRHTVGEPPIRISTPESSVPRQGVWSKSAKFLPSQSKKRKKTPFTRPTDQTDHDLEKIDQIDHDLHHLELTLPLIDVQDIFNAHKISLQTYPAAVGDAIQSRKVTRVREMQHIRLLPGKISQNMQIRNTSALKYPEHELRREQIIHTDHPSEVSVLFAEAAKRDHDTCTGYDVFTYRDGAPKDSECPRKFLIVTDAGTSKIRRVCDLVQLHAVV